MIKIENVSKIFNPRSRNKNQVLKNVSFELPDKGLVAIFGKSGSGKTTLLNIIGGLDKQNGGKVIIDGECTSGKADKIRNAKIGYIFQNYYLEKGYTITEILRNQMLIAGFKDESEIERRTQEVLKLVDMERYKNKRADALSGGQQQRVAIARAIIKGSDVILADEPTGNLDAENTMKVMDILKEISKTQLVVLVTHEVTLIKRYADSHIKIVDGEIVADSALEGYEEANETYAVPHEKKESPITLSFTKSESRHNGRLFNFKNIIKSFRRSEEKAFSGGNVFKQIFILAMAVVMCFFAFSAFEALNTTIENKTIDENSVYVNTDTYSDVRQIDESLYDSVDFFETQYKSGGFSYNGVASLSGITADYTLKAIETDDTEIESRIEYGKMPGEGEILISRALAEKLKTEVRLTELQNDRSMLLVLFEGNYPVSGIVSGSEPAVYMNKENYANFLGVYGSVSLADYNCLFLESAYANATFTGEILLADNSRGLADNEAEIEINRNSLYKMMNDVTQADYKVNLTNSRLAATGTTSTAIQIVGSKPMYVQKFEITRGVMTTDIRIYVSEKALKNIFVYLEPDIDSLNGTVSSFGIRSRFYFEIKTNGGEQLSALKAKLADRGIGLIDINAIYAVENAEIKTEASQELAVFPVIAALLLLIFFFIEKSSSIRNSKEYGIYRAIGVNRGNLLKKELMVALFGNMISYFLFSLITVILVCARYGVMNVAFGGFIGLAAAFFAVSALLMPGISLIPYLFVLYQTPAQILSRYDI